MATDQGKGSDELCEIGEELWSAIFSINCGSKIAYDEYLEHIHKCEKCKKYYIKEMQKIEKMNKSNLW